METVNSDPVPETKQYEQILTGLRISLSIAKGIATPFMLFLFLWKDCIIYILTPSLVGQVMCCLLSGGFNNMIS